MKLGTKLAGNDKVGLFIGGIKKENGVIVSVLLRVTLNIPDSDNRTVDRFSMSYAEFTAEKDWNQVLVEKLK